MGQLAGSARQTVALQLYGLVALESRQSDGRNASGRNGLHGGESERRVTEEQEKGFRGESFAGQSG